jgi:hypothetical protein
MEDEYEDLEQCDSFDSEYIEEVQDKFSPLLGLFLIRFSFLEHELNIAIAEFFYDDIYEPGYIITERLTTDNKIDLFYKLYFGLASFKGERSKKALNQIREKLKKLNTFRNICSC